MEINLIFKIAAVGIIISILNQILKHSGRDTGSHAQQADGSQYAFRTETGYLYVSHGVFDYRSGIPCKSIKN